MHGFKMSSESNISRNTFICFMHKKKYMYNHCYKTENINMFSVETCDLPVKVYRLLYSYAV